MSSVTAKSINFNVHDMQRIEETAQSKWTFSLSIGSHLSLACFIAHIDPIEREVRELAESIFAIKDEQEYIVARERQHRNSKYACDRPSPRPVLTIAIL